MSLSEAKLILSTLKMPLSPAQLKLYKEAFAVVCRLALSPPN